MLLLEEVLFASTGSVSRAFSSSVFKTAPDVVGSDEGTAKLQKGRDTGGKWRY